MMLSYLTGAIILGDSEYFWILDHKNDFDAKIFLFIIVMHNLPPAFFYYAIRHIKQNVL